MGKKGKRSTGAGGNTAKQGPGKARRERSLALREIETRIEALVEKLKDEVKNVTLFGPLIPREECPICFVPMPRREDQISYKACCGKHICEACNRHSIETCVKTAIVDNQRLQWHCPFCRSGSVLWNDEESIEGIQKRVLANDLDAMLYLSGDYEDGSPLFEKDDIAAIRLQLQAAESGYPKAIARLADRCFEGGSAVPRNFVYALHLANAAARKGYVPAYSLLGAMLKDTTDAMLKKNITADDSELLVAKCFQFAARDGDKVGMECLDKLKKEGTIFGIDINDVKRQYKEALMMEWSEEREKVNPDYYKELSL